MSLRSDQLAGALALLGTTLTAYVYMWETIAQGVDEPHANRGGAGLARARVGAVIGAINLCDPLVHAGDFRGDAWATP